jgi:hypothetical protein
MTTARSSSRSSCGRPEGLPYVLAAVIIAAAPISAHRLDEYLQAARLDIDQSRVELFLDLTPGVAVAERVLSDIDVNANRSISAVEAHDYVERVLGAIAVDVDGTPVRLVRLDHDCPAVNAMLQGVGTLHVRAAAALPRQTEGLHHLRYRNANRPDIGVYLANALVPASDRVAVTGQRRTPNQQELIVDYTVSPAPVAETGRQILIVLIAVMLTAAFWRWSRRYA